MINFATLLAASAVFAPTAFAATPDFVVDPFFSQAASRITIPASGYVYGETADASNFAPWQVVPCAEVRTISGAAAGYGTSGSGCKDGEFELNHDYIVDTINGVQITSYDVDLNPSSTGGVFQILNIAVPAGYAGYASYQLAFDLGLNSHCGGQSASTNVKIFDANKNTLVNDQAFPSHAGYQTYTIPVNLPVCDQVKIQFVSQVLNTVCGPALTNVHFTPTGPLVSGNCVAGYPADIDWHIISSYMDDYGIEEATIAEASVFVSGTWAPVNHNPDQHTNDVTVGNTIAWLPGPIMTYNDL
ncbi:hypothetical protein BC830DRAFT_1175633, partial [Chytriomyces sp. MP71]